MLDVGVSIKTLKSHVKQNVKADHLIGDVLDILEALNKNVDGNTLMLSYVKPDKPQEELKPCLVCDSTRVEYQESKDFDFQGQDSRSIKCNGCGLLLEVPKHTVAKQQLISRWNRRSNA